MEKTKKCEPGCVAVALFDIDRRFGSSTGGGMVDNAHALMNAGFVLPARTQSDHASDAAAAMRLQGSFDASLADELCNYVYFAPDGTVLETNLSGRRLADAKEARRTLEGGAWF